MRNLMGALPPNTAPAATKCARRKHAPPALRPMRLSEGGKKMRNITVYTY